MKKKFVVISFFCLAAFSSIQAQSINNKDWKAAFGMPFNDTLTFHMQSDSSYVANSKGQILIRTRCTLSKDTIIISDYGTEEYSCPDMVGKYKIIMEGKMLTLSMIEDNCEGRRQAMNGTKWVEADKHSH